jgi:hypothetical protein
MDTIKLPELSNDYLKEEAEASRTKNLVVNKHWIESPMSRVKLAVVKYNKKEIYAIIAVVVAINLFVLVLYRRRMKRQQN